MNRPDEQRWERAKKWLETQTHSVESLYWLPEFLVRYEHFLMECEEKRQAK